MKKLLLPAIACLTAMTAVAQMKIAQTGLTTFQKGITVETSQNQVLDLKFTGAAGGSKPLIYMTSSTTSKRALIAYYGGILTYSFEGHGSLYARGGVLQSSDSSRKNNISGLNSSLDKITALRGVRFDYTAPDSGAPRPATRSFSSAASGRDPAAGADEMAWDEEVDPQVQQQIEQEKNRQRIGLIAQEVEQVLPEVVRTLPDGSKGIYYTDMVGVLVEAVKELKDSLASLKEEVAALNAVLYPQNGPQHSPQRSVSGNSPLGNAEEPPGLSQNSPNPFNRQTVIRYRLSAQTGNARICIYNLSGSQLKQYSLPSGETAGTLTILADEFPPGIYLYSLIADGQEIDSKRMILTE